MLVTYLLNDCEMTAYLFAVKMNFIAVLLGIVGVVGVECADLLPFGVSAGDQLVPPADDGNSAPQSKLAVANITCPFYGANESIIYVRY